MQKLILILFFFLNFENVFSNEEYFLTLRNEEVNLRQGPSFDYPVKIFYKKKYLPPNNFVEKLKNRFSPYCSVATWYLWRSIDDEPIQY